MMVKLLLILLAFSSAIHAKTNLSCKNKEEMLKDKRSQGAGWIWFVGEGMAFTQEDAFFKAEGQSLDRLKSECGHIPKAAKFHERCIDKVGDRFHSYVRVNILARECSKSQDANRHEYLESKLVEYRTHLSKKDSEESFSCRKTEVEKCFKAAVKKYDEGSISEALKLFKSSCELGFAKSCINLGPLYYYDGKLKQALRYLESSCSNKNPQSCHLSSLIYFDDNKIAQARKLASMACRLGELKSCYNLAKTEIDLKTQVNALLTNCSKGHGLSCHEVALNFYDNNEFKKSNNYFMKACKESYLLKSCFNAARIQRAILKKSTQAKMLFVATCRLGHQLSCDEI